MKKNFCYFLMSIAFLTSSVLIVSCNNELEESFISEDVSVDYLRVIKMMGFDTSDIIEEDDYFVVEGDICICKGEIPKYNLVGTRQARMEHLVRLNKQGNIQVKIDSSLPTTGDDNWRGAIQEAINEWNQVGSSIKMSLTTSNVYDILIRSDNGLLGNNFLAQASWPSANGNPGPTIDINLDSHSDSFVSNDGKTHTMVHELGHCLGFRHTNWRGHEASGITIPGTPNEAENPDPSSVMNGRKISNSWNGFSTYDIVAIRVLYNGCYIFGPDYLCDASNQTFTLVNVPPGATVSWSQHGSDSYGSYLYPSQYIGNPYPARNISQRDERIGLKATVTLSDGYSYQGAYTSVSLYNSQSSGAYIETSDNMDFVLMNHDGWATNFYWEVSDGIIYVQGRNYTLIDFPGWGPYTVVCKYTNRCGNRVTVTKEVVF